MGKLVLALCSINLIGLITVIIIYVKNTIKNNKENYETHYYMRSIEERTERIYERVKNNEVKTERLLLQDYEVINDDDEKITTKNVYFHDLFLHKKVANKYYGNIEKEYIFWKGNFYKVYATHPKDGYKLELIGDE